ncbi:MAG: aldose 1-epimerase family protein [Ferrimicrobium sp.]
MNIYPSGQQLAIDLGDQHATVVEVGGGLREYTLGERHVLEPYSINSQCDGAHGAPLIPWPNRLSDGRYHFDGVDHQVALSEPRRSNAIHGLLRWRSWQVRHIAPSQVTMGIRIFPMPGYPFLLDVEVTYSLSDEGLRITTTATNEGDSTCPYGTGQHPYLSPGSRQSIDDCTLEVSAMTRVTTDDERQLPTGVESVEGTSYDFRTPRTLGDQRLDFGFTDLIRDHDGRAWARLVGPDSRCVELWVDESYSIIQLYTGDTLAPGRQRTGLGAEPMTCPPNAFQSGDGLIRLDPGKSTTATWGVHLR